MEYLHEANGFDETILQRQYEYFKDKPGRTLIGTRVKLMILKPGAVTPDSNHEQGNWDPLNAPDDISTEKYLNYHLGEKLGSQPVGDSLQICFLTLNHETTQDKLSFWHSAIETFRGCQRDLQLAPARVITQRIESAWNLQSVKPPATSQLTSDQLPSKKPPKRIGVLSNDTEKTYSLHWQSALLKYENDLYVYVWQPHLERIPSACYNSATIVIPTTRLDPRTSASSAHLFLVIANPPSLMPKFLDTKDAFVRSGQTQHAWDADHEKLRVLAIFFRWMVEDSSKLVDDMMFKATEMTYKGRRLPTRSKIQYLIHLDDCRRLAILDLKHGKTVVDKARSTVEMAEFCCKKQGGLDEATAIKTFSSFQDDFEFLIMKFEALETTLSTAREQINEQMSLAQGQRALVLTIAAAFFIPLSFIASIFGMNVQEPLFPSKKTTTTTTTPTISPTPTANVDPSEPSQHYWTMSQYLEISLPLTFGVILLPLIAGPWFRLASQQYDVHSQHWRALFVVFCACYLISLIITSYVKGGSLGGSFANMVFVMTSYGISGLIGIVCTVSAFRNGKGRLRWSLQPLVAGVCLFLTFMVQQYVPWALGPFLYMFLTSKMGIRCFKRIWTWLRRKNKRQTVPQNSSGTTV